MVFCISFSGVSSIINEVLLSVETLMEVPPPGVLFLETWHGTILRIYFTAYWISIPIFKWALFCLIRLLSAL
jgi:hypothetical protein